MNRYPLQRVEIYKDHDEARAEFKKTEKEMSYPEVVFIVSQLKVDTHYISMRFIGRENIDTLRGIMLDKVVFHFQPTDSEMSMVRSMVKPNTTVQRPISIIDTE